VSQRSSLSALQAVSSREIKRTPHTVRKSVKLIDSDTKTVSKGTVFVSGNGSRGEELLLSYPLHHLLSDSKRNIIVGAVPRCLLEPSI
jgi:hypothetical protein